MNGINLNSKNLNIKNLMWMRRKVLREIGEKFFFITIESARGWDRFYLNRPHNPNYHEKNMLCI